MSSVIISGDTSGAITIAAPAVAGTNTLTLQAATATSAVNTLATAVASTSGTAIDFTGLPAWIKRITVMFSGVSTSGTSFFLAQIGSGSVVTTGYVGAVGTNAGTTNNFSTGFTVYNNTVAADSFVGTVVLTLIGSNTWIESGVIYSQSSTRAGATSAGSLTLGGTLDRIRITTVNGTDTFDAGSVNILYEG